MGVCYRGIVEIISSINRDLSFKADKFFEEFGVTKLEAIYTRMIEDNPGITQYELAKAKRCSKNLVVKHIKKIEDKGFVEKRADGQKKRLYLTKLGKEISQAVTRSVDETGSVMFAGIPEEERKKYLEISKKIRKNFQEHMARDIFNNINYKL